MEWKNITTIDPRTVAAAWFLRRRHRTLWNLPLTAGLVVYIALLLIRETIEDPQTNFNLSRQAVLALNQPTVPDDENAAEIYKLAAAAMVPFSGPEELNPLYKFWEESKTYEISEVQAWLSANSKTISLLYAAVENERCGWKIDLSIIPNASPPLLQIRQLTSLLTNDARSQAHKGDHLGAAKSIATVHKMARHLESFPSLMNLLISDAIRSNVYSALEGILACDTPTINEDLAAYRIALLQDQDLNKRMANWANCMEFEKKCSLAFVDGIYAGMLNPPKGIHKPNTFSPLTYGAMRRCYIAVMDDIISSFCLGKLPEDIDILITRHQIGPATRVQDMLYFSRIFGSFFSTEEEARLCNTALAFLQFRIKYGRDAVTLAELVPEFLSAIPTGVYHVEHVRARVVDRCHENHYFARYQSKPAVVIYTVGPNGKDDGGLNESNPDDTHFLIPSLIETTSGKVSQEKP